METNTDESFVNKELALLVFNYTFLPIPKANWQSNSCKNRHSIGPKSGSI